MDLLKELLQYLDELKQYREMLTNPDSKLLEAKRKNELFTIFPFLQDTLPQKSKEEVLEKIRENLVRKSGGLTKSISDIMGKEIYIEKFGRTYNIWRTGLAANPSAPINFDCLNACIDVVNEVIGKLEAEHEAEKEKQMLELFEEPKISTEKPSKEIKELPKAFIAHGGQSEALEKLKEFLIALGVEPLVVEEQASKNRSIGTNVDWYARQADCAIILATKGDIDGETGGFIPRGNVLIEIGKAQEIFKDRIIYLLQAGTKFPTNISEKVWGRFTSSCMDEALIKVTRELTAFGILNAVKPIKGA